VERRALSQQQRQWRGSGSGVSESASVSGGVAARGEWLRGSEWSCALHREQPRVRRAGQLGRAVSLGWVMGSSATVGLVRQAKEKSLDLQLVGDLSGRCSGRPCVWSMAGK
jgi:hypothetical protein